ncbi:hypothetical protein EC991_009746 [Linnemannia zychae]|nr:hypothetical protein EC991_009746 [Linnemannia zychae]
MVEQTIPNTSLPPHSPLPVDAEDPFDTDSGQEGSSSSKPTASKKHLTPKHYDLMLDWLERPGHYNMVFGSSGKTTVGGKETKSSSKAYEEWAVHVNETGKLSLTGKTLKARFGRYLTRYKNVKQQEKLTGYGLTDEDYSNRIRTIAQRFEKDCPCFERMDNIFGNKPNVHALANMEGGLTTRLEVQGQMVDLDGLYDDDGETVFDQDDFLSVDEDNRATQSGQDRLVAIVDDPAEDRDEEGAAGLVRRAKRATAPSNRDVPSKRPKMNVTRVPPPKLNTGAPQAKGGSFSAAFLEGMKAKAESALKVEQSKLDWERDKWMMEAERRSEERKLEADRRLEERKTNLLSQRLALVTALVKQGVTDKDFLSELINKTDV